MIPNNITRDHILQALFDIDREGVPPHRKSTRYSLVENGRMYPPKYVITLSNRYANGQELSSFEFHGGPEANDFIASRGFEIVDEDGNRWE